jgi:transcription elongation GreA/GreB family factor
MSVAFVREESAEAAAEAELPDRPISPHPNLVTASGFQALQKAFENARDAYEAARSLEDVNERRRSIARPLRDMRYFRERLRTAELMAAPASADRVGFGNRVTLERADGRRQTFRIIGEDEADPAAGSLSYFSPLARALNGKSAGDITEFRDEEIEVISIDA